MNRKRLLIFLIILIAASCNETTTTPVDNIKVNANLLFILQGQVQVKKTAWTNYNQISSGAFLSNEDLIFPSLDSRTIVLCDDLEFWLVPAGIQSSVNNGCNDSIEPYITRPHGDIGNTRGSADPSSPYPIYPRASKILSDKPVLRWNAVSNATRYNVQIEYNGQALWTAETNNNQIDYPGIPALIPGNFYTLVVYTDTGKSSKDEAISSSLGGVTINQSFQLADSDEIHEIESMEEKISSSYLSTTDRAYAISVLYSSQGFYSESMLLLEKVLEMDSNNLYALFNLGNNELTVGLPFLAKNNFETLLNNSNLTNDLELRATTLESLAIAYLNTGYREKALQTLEQAEIAFETLGDKVHAQELQHLILKISP